MHRLRLIEIVKFALFALSFCVISLPDGFGAYRVFLHKTPFGHILELMFAGFSLLFIFHLLLNSSRKYYLSPLFYVIVFYIFIFVIYILLAIAESHNIVDIVNDVRVIPWLFSYVFGLVLINNEKDFFKLFNVFIIAVIFHVFITLYLVFFDESSVIEINRDTFLDGTKRVWFRNSILYFTFTAWVILVLIRERVVIYKKTTLLFLLCLTMLSIIYTQSRMLIGLSLLMIVIVIFFANKKNFIAKVVIALFVSIMAFLLVNIIEPVLIDTITARFTSAMSLDDNSLVTRLFTYKSTIDAGMDFIISGHGVGTQITTSHPDIISGDHEFNFIDNAFISIFYKMGLIGVILLSVLCLAYYREIRLLPLTFMSPKFSVIISSLLFSLIFVFVYSFITGAFFLYTRSLVFVYFVLLGAATSCVRTKSKINIY